MNGSHSDVAELGGQWHEIKCKNNLGKHSTSEPEVMFYLFTISLSYVCCLTKHQYVSNVQNHGQIYLRRGSLDNALAESEGDAACHLLTVNTHPKWHLVTLNTSEVSSSDVC